MADMIRAPLSGYQLYPVGQSRNVVWYMLEQQRLLSASGLVSSGIQRLIVNIYPVIR